MRPISERVEASADEVLLDRRHRQVLLGVSWALAAAAVAAPPLFAGSGIVALQVIVGLAAMTWFVAQPFTQGSLVIALGGVALECALTLPGSTFPAVPIVVSAVLSLAACEGLALARMWNSRGVLRWSTEQVHVLAAGRRIGIGAGAATWVLLLGFVELPSPAVIATVGALATAVVVWILATRSA